MSNVLLLTLRDDDAATLPVAEALRARGHTPWRLDCDRLVGEIGLTWRGPGDGWLDLPGQGRLHLDAIHAIWNRRLRPGGGSALPPELRGPTLGEWRHALVGALHDAPAFWVDPPSIVAHLAHKSPQLALARLCGLRVPPTLETNDPEEARAFVARHPEGVVVKMYGDLSRGDRTVFTTRLSEDDLAALDDVAYGPTLLQAAIPVHREVRAIVVGDRVFAAALDPRPFHGDQVDWRRVGRESLTSWVPYTLHGDVEAALLDLHRRLYLHYGAADLLLTPDGELVFLETNPVGECFWLYPLLPIAPSIADLLAGERPLRVLPWPCDEVVAEPPRSR